MEDQVFGMCSRVPGYPQSVHPTYTPLGYFFLYFCPFPFALFCFRRLIIPYYTQHQRWRIFCRIFLSFTLFTYPFPVHFPNFPFFFLSSLFPFPYFLSFFFPFFIVLFQATDGRRRSVCVLGRDLRGRSTPAGWLICSFCWL